MEILEFARDEAYCLLIKIEEYFDTFGTPNVYKIAEALEGLEGSALSWWRWCRLYNPPAA